MCRGQPVPSRTPAPYADGVSRQLDELVRANPALRTTVRVGVSPLDRACSRGTSPRLGRGHCYGQLVTDRSGAGPIDLAVLAAVDTCGAGRPDGYAPCLDVLALIEERTGLGPRYAYDVLLDLARRWMIAVPVIEGNIGARQWPGDSEPRYVECRALRAGQAVLDAEAGRSAPVPAGLINGTAYRGGIQPPLEPSRCLAALRHLLDHPDAPDGDILALAGPPWPVSDCTVTGDLDALAAGHRVMLRQTGRISLTGNPIPPPQLGLKPPGGGPCPVVVLSYSIGLDLPRQLADAQLVIESLPPDTSLEQVCRDLARHAEIQASHADGGASSDVLPTADVADLGTDRVPVRIAITLIPGTDPEAARDQLAAFDGITSQAPAAYPAPLATMLRAWTDQHRGEDLNASLTRFEDAIRQDRADKSGADP